LSSTARRMRQRAFTSEKPTRQQSTMNYGFVSKNATIQHALTSIDNFIAKNVGVALRRYPQARIMFIFYVALLHLWVLFILTHFMHHESGGTSDASSITTKSLPLDPQEFQYVKSNFSGLT
jgi:hypothetical protein